MTSTSTGFLILSPARQRGLHPQPRVRHDPGENPELAGPFLSQGCARGSAARFTKSIKSSDITSDKLPNLAAAPIRSAARRNGDLGAAADDARGQEPRRRDRARNAGCNARLGTEARNSS